MGTSSANWRGVVHRSNGQLVGIGNAFHFGLYGIDTGPWSEVLPTAAASIQAAAAQSDSATVSAVLATAWASDWAATANALNAAGAPAGTLVTSCRDWFNNTTF